MIELSQKMLENSQNIDELIEESEDVSNREEEYQ